MSKRQKKPSIEDRKIWHKVAKTVTAYKQLEEIDDAEFTKPASSNQDTKKSPTADRPMPLRSTPDPYRPALQKPGSKQAHLNPPGLNPIERPVHRKISKGRVSIDGRIDLHGMTQHIAHRALYDFLLQSKFSGAHHVLVITGKGTSSGGHGILRQVVPQWFEKPEFKDLVSGFKVSAQHHGGDGALYVRIRRERDAPR